MLQGMEAVYLARKSGMDTMVIDMNDQAPALSLADEGYVLDVCSNEEEAKRLLCTCDAVLPANENIETLTALCKLLKKMDIPLLFDLDAYKISSSKLSSNKLMEALSIPTPQPWPKSGFPVVIKPSGQSGSTGVVKAYNENQLGDGIRKIESLDDEPIIQEFVDGPNISIEVIGNGETFVPAIMTEVILDDRYDCKMVRCPMQGISREVELDFLESSRRLAESVSLRGIMDVEAIVNDNEAKVLEIDARIPSQTPAAIYNATGVNLIELLTYALTDGELDEVIPQRRGASIYEHIAIDGNTMRSCGEGVFSEVRKPRLISGLFGSDEMVTDFEHGKSSWRATIICNSSTPEGAWQKRQRCLNNIMKSENITYYFDPQPEVRA